MSTILNRARGGEFTTALSPSRLLNSSANLVMIAAWITGARSGVRCMKWNSMPVYDLDVDTSVGCRIRPRCRDHDGQDIAHESVVPRIVSHEDEPMVASGGRN
jgi:hypothetical protein